MTILVGITCREGIVVASDSRTSELHSMQDDAKKIHHIVFANAEPALVAEAGYALPAGNSIEQIRKMALSMPLKAISDAEDAAKQAMYHTRDAIFAMYPNPARGDDEMRRIYSDHSHDLVIASLVGGVPNLGVMTFGQSFMALKKPHVAVGKSSLVADFMLRRFRDDFPQMSLSHAVVLAISIVSGVIEIDKDCGGPVQVACLRPGSEGLPSSVEFTSAETVLAVLAGLKGRQESVNAQWMAETYSLIEEVAGQWLDSSDTTVTTTTPAD